MQLVALLTLLLVSVASATPNQPEQAPNVHSAPVPAQPAQGVQVVGQSAPILGQNAPVVGSSNVENVQPSLEQPPHHQQPNPSAASYYAPAGLVTVVGEQGVNKPVASVRNFEQYGQPESASIPPNYKPFGSWGLYIGGNPADGYYTNYYKALGNSVDKQQAGEPVKPVPTAALSPFLRQASSSPYVGNDYYSFAYSPLDLNSPSRVAVEPVHSVSHAPVQALSPVQAGAQVYGSPASFESNYGVSPYADSYATKKVGAAYAQKELTKEVPLAQPAKGYQSRVYVYPPVVSSPLVPLSAPAVGQQQYSPNQQHVVAYPVPVGSQIVGSQQGVEGAFNPYGVHAFTRYAVKPTAVSHDQQYYYGVHSPLQAPVYKQQVYQPQAGVPYYPLNQLHYSQGSVFPSVHSEPHHVPVQPALVEVTSDKVENEERNSLYNKQQAKRA